MSVYKRRQLAASRTASSIRVASHEADTARDDITCLETQGFSIHVLAQTRLRAAALGVSPAHLLLAEGTIRPELFYKAFAQSLGTHFTMTPPAFERRLDWASALTSGAARLADGRWLIAPQDNALSTLQRRLSRRPRHDLLITTPQNFVDAIHAQFAAKIADHAVTHLAIILPGQSAREGVGLGQKIALAASAGLVFFGIVDGGILWTLACAMFSAAVAFGVGLRFAASFAALARPCETARPLSDKGLPFYTLLVPLYREGNVVSHLIKNLAALDYPAAKCEVLFLVEEGDASTHQAIAAQHLPAHFRVIIAPTGAPRTKPRALNIGLAHARRELLVIYDAEDQPDTDQLRKAAAAFAKSDPKLACLQASLAIENAKDSWLTRLFAIDYAGHFDVLLLGWSRLKLPMPLGGTSNHFRTAHLRAAGGWDAWNVTEDADLGLRLARLGYACRMLDSTTWEEAPPCLADWLPQRRRWMKGWMQTCLTHTRNPLRLWRELGQLRATHILALLIANTFGPLVGIWFTVYVLWHAYLGDLVPGEDWQTFLANLCWTGLALIGFASLFLPTLIGAFRRGLLTSLAWITLRALHWLFMSLAAAQAMVELVTRPFHWAKTQHGLSKARAQDPA